MKELIRKIVKLFNFFVFDVLLSKGSKMRWS